MRLRRTRADFVVEFVCARFVGAVILVVEASALHVGRESRLIEIPRFVLRSRLLRRSILVRPR